MSTNSKMVCVVCSFALAAAGIAIATEQECPHGMVCQPALFTAVDGPHDEPSPGLVGPAGGDSMILSATGASATVTLTGVSATGVAGAVGPTGPALTGVSAEGIAGTVG